MGKSIIRDWERELVLVEELIFQGFIEIWNMHVFNRISKYVIKNVYRIEKRYRQIYNRADFKALFSVIGKNK